MLRVLKPNIVRLSDLAPKIKCLGCFVHGHPSENFIHVTLHDRMVKVATHEDIIGLSVRHRGNVDRVNVVEDRRNFAVVVDLRHALVYNEDNSI
jgi:hypothetical protein